MYGPDLESKENNTCFDMIPMLAHQYQVIFTMITGMHDVVSSYDSKDRCSM